MFTPVSRGQPVSFEPLCLRGVPSKTNKLLKDALFCLWGVGEAGLLIGLCSEYIWQERKVTELRGETYILLALPLSRREQISWSSFLFETRFLHL